MDKEFDREYETVLLSALKYALDKNDYVIFDVTHYISLNIPNISKPTLLAMVKEANKKASYDANSTDIEKHWYMFAKTLKSFAESK